VKNIRSRGEPLASGKGYALEDRLRLDTATRKVAAKPIPTMIDAIGKPGIPEGTIPVVIVCVAVVVVVSIAVDVLVPKAVVPEVWVAVTVAVKVLVCVPTVVDEKLVEVPTTTSVSLV
jgi:hypothetical protein